MGESLVPVDLPPGILRNGTQYQASGRWYDCNLVRWVDGAVRPVGGWAHFTSGPTGKIGYYAFTLGSAPAGGATSSTLLIAWTRPTGTWNVTFSNGDVRPVAFTYGQLAGSAISWTTPLSSAATTSAAADVTTYARWMHAWVTNGGTQYLAVGCSSRLYVNKGDAVLKDITPAGFIAGGDVAYGSLGYGGGTYGTSTYGTARTVTSATMSQPTVWSLDNFGENLLALAPNPAGSGQLYKWSLDYATPTPAALVAAAPVNCSGMIVTEQRHVMLFGAGGNQRKVQWSAKEDETTWTPAATNEAGSFELQTVGQYVRAVRIRGQILVLTTTDAHVMNYLGQPYIFNRERIGVDCGPLGPGAVAVTGGMVPWMGQKRFWVYNGGTVTQLQSDVADYVYSDIDFTQAYKVTSAHIGQFGEIWWFYPSAGSLENDSYVIWNYRENHWAIGSMSRTAWVDAGVFGYPTAAGTDGILYRHEQGNTADGSPMYPSVYAETGALELPPGDNVIGVSQLIADEKTKGDVTVSFRSRFSPEGDEYSFGPYAVNAKGFADVRLSGRQIVMRVQPVADKDWRVGKYRLMVNALSKR